MFNFEDANKMGKDMMDNSMKSFAAMTKGFQDIAAETADFAKKSFDDNAKAMEKMMAVKTLDKAFELQADFAKSSYEAMVAQGTKVSEMVTAMAKDAYKPFEAAIAKAK